MPVIGMLLSGAGVQDGSEIHETVLAALHLEKGGANIVFIAPDMPQAKIVNHLTGSYDSDKRSRQQRNVLVESARIARGKIREVSTINSDELDGLVLPGGSGVALNLCNFTEQERDCIVNPATGALITSMLAQKKPVGALCLAPVVIAAVCRDMGIQGARLTIGNNALLANSLKKMGATHVKCKASECVIDHDNRIVTTPAYMLAGSLAELDKGIADWATSYLALFASTP